MSRLLASLQSLIRKQLDDHGLVVWYDPEGHYREVVPRLGLGETGILSFEDSYIRLRAALEPWLEWTDELGQPVPDRESPPGVLVYVPKSREGNGHILVEAEAAGVVLEPGAPLVECNTRLSVLAERVLGAIAPEKAPHVARQVDEGLLNFAELEKLTEDSGGKAAGTLKVLFGQISPLEMLLAFVSSAERDAGIEEKKAIQELVTLAGEELGFRSGAVSSPVALREALHHYLLLGETALTLAEASSSPVWRRTAVPEKAAQRDSLKRLCETWRNRMDLQESYAEAAEKVAQAAGISAQDFPLGGKADALETFPQTDEALLNAAVQSLRNNEPGQPMEQATNRRTRFWNRRQPRLQLQWSLVESMAGVLHEVQSVSQTLKKKKWKLAELIQAYTGMASPWLLLDTRARHMESRYARMEFEWNESGPDWEQCMVHCRRGYLDCLNLMAEAWSAASREAEFASPTALPQGRVFRDEVAPLIQKPAAKAAYLLVDALRYEMAVELVDGLREEFTVSMKPVLGQLPGITPVGMAALMPGAEDGLILESESGKCVVMIGARKLPHRNARMEWLQERVEVPVLIWKLNDAIRLTPKKRKEIGSVSFIVVTSQEIDRIGEAGGDDEEARIYMDEVLEKLRRAIRNLAASGVTDFVVTADHGFVFAEGAEDGWRMDSPGGHTAELHRRCWIGKGGEQADGFFRVAASALELGGGLECAFPCGMGTFRVKGSVGSYWHGGVSAQEQILPLIHLKPTVGRPSAGHSRIKLRYAKNSITNRFFSVSLSLESSELLPTEARQIRVEILSGKVVVGQAAMAAYGFEEGTKEIQVRPDQENSVTLMLECSSPPQVVTLQVTDSKSGLVLTELPDIPVNLAL